ncbi:MAG: caspase family protein, partial [Xanthomonadales bacterium]|nr:caspase family protein [Xanthomonadales bacterium]
MPAKHALLIGVDKYGNLDKKYELAGCVNDARLMKSILVDQFHFDDKAITELHNEQATRENILANLNRLASDIAQDDIVVVHFSGHGSRRTAADPDAQRDCTIMPTDSGRHPLPNLDITDQEINEWLGRMAQRTSYITLTFDCCHSGTMTRDAFGEKTRSVPDDTRSLEEMQVQSAPTRAIDRQDLGPSGWLAISESYVVMSGCRDDQLSHEFTQEDKGAHIRNGALTHFLTTALVGAKPGSTYRDVFEQARQAVNTKFPSQSPQIEGRQDREVFGVRDIEPIRFIPLKSVDGDDAVIAGGAAHGLHSGATWKVYPPGTKDTEGVKALATLEITSVGALETKARVKTRSGDLEPGARCVESAPAAGQFLVKVDLSAVPADQQSRLSERFGQSRLLSLETTAAAADLRVYVLEPRGEAKPDDPVPQAGAISEATIAVIDRAGLLAMPLHVLSEEGVADTILENLETRARYANALQLDNPASRLDVEFNIHAEDGDDNWVLANGGDYQYTAGDRIAFE